MLKIQAKSYGVIPIFKKEDGFYVLLVKNSKGGHWGLPKGTPEKGEEPIDTARRELFEETGIKDVDIKTEVTFEEKYDFEQDSVVYDKTVVYYPGFVNEMIESSQDQLDMIDEIKWVRIDVAKDALTHQAAIDIVKKLAEWLNHSIY